MATPPFPLAVAPMYPHSPSSSRRQARVRVRVRVRVLPFDRSPPSEMPLPPPAPPTEGRASDRLGQARGPRRSHPLHGVGVRPRVRVPCVPLGHMSLGFTNERGPINSVRLVGADVPAPPVPDTGARPPSLSPPPSLRSRRGRRPGGRGWMGPASPRAPPPSPPPPPSCPGGAPPPPPCTPPLFLGCVPGPGSRPSHGPAFIRPGGGGDQPGLGGPPRPRRTCRCTRRTRTTSWTRGASAS